MSIDISIIKEGDTVVFRNGGRSIVNKQGNALYVVDTNLCYWGTRGLKNHITDSDLDIISIERKPEPKKEIDVDAVAAVLCNHFSDYPRNESEIKACIPAARAAIAEINRQRSE